MSLSLSLSFTFILLNYVYQISGYALSHCDTKPKVLGGFLMEPKGFSHEPILIQIVCNADTESQLNYEFLFVLIIFCCGLVVIFVFF